MNEKEISEIRRRFKPNKNSITHIRGCYVNEQREVVTQFSQSLGFMPEEECEKLLGVLKKSLSGTLNRNLFNLSFSTEQVVSSPEHKLLMELRSSGLENNEAVGEFYSAVIESVSIEGSYLILMAHDKYDVPFNAKDGSRLEDLNTDVFSYILCGICPVKIQKPALGYFITENSFKSIKPDWLVGAPELGFMFPAFDDRSANIYETLYYTKSTVEIGGDFAARIFNCEIPMPAKEQQEVFNSVLAESLGESCNLDVVQAVNARLCEIIEEHKENKEEPLVVTKNIVSDVLSDCGATGEQLTTFSEKFTEELGADAAISPHNIINSKKLSMELPEIDIKVNAEFADLVETRVIDGVKYILIRADSGVQVNGLQIHIE